MNFIEPSISESIAENHDIIFGIFFILYRSILVHFEELSTSIRMKKMTSRWNNWKENILSLKRKNLEMK